MLRASSVPFFQYISPTVPDILTRIEEMKDPAKAAELQQQQQMGAMGGMGGGDPMGGGVPMPGMPPTAGGAPAGVQGGPAPQGQQQQIDPAVVENDKAFKEALISVIGKEAALKFYKTGQLPDMSGKEEKQEAPQGG